MKEKPILFSGPMVRAILRERKSQTRRAFKCPVPDGWNPAVGYYPREAFAMLPHANRLMKFGAYDEDCCVPSPFGAPGSRLWVREMFDIESFGAGVAQIRYMADDKPGKNVSDKGLPNRLGIVSAIHMPRGCSRITLEITNVRVERLMSISKQDAIEEGVASIAAFAETWDQINGPDAWCSNPWVWVLEFRRVACS